MISLNLLSPKQKETLEARIVYALLERLLILIVVSALIVTIVLLGVKIELTKRLTDIEARQTLSSEYLSVNKETTRLNLAVARIDKIETVAVPVTGMFFDIFKRVPGGVQLHNLNLDTRSAAVSINGLADTREHLLAFTEALRGSPYVKKVESPVSNLFQKTNVSFTLQTIVDLGASATNTAKEAVTPNP